jgi:hypothetical protein
MLYFFLSPMGVLSNYMSHERKTFIKLTRRYAYLLFIFLNIPLLLALGSALHSYKGTCQGFTDGSWPCKFGTFLNNEFTIGSMLNFITAPICFAFWGVAVGDYYKFKFGKSGIFNILPFIGVIIGLLLGFVISFVYPWFLGLIITR